MDDDLIKAQINALIRDEIQEGINEWIDEKEDSEKTGLGFAQKTVSEDGDELKVNIPQSEVDKLLKEYKKIKKRQKKSILHQEKILDKHGRRL